ncbi:MAG: alginate export family protein, partial [Deltaproteobacteria bacterium]|nr:alginate export family protein [Deltaproteobacteria bacterium]
MIKKGWLLFLAVVLTAGFAGTSYAAGVDLSGQVVIKGEYRDNANFNDAVSDGTSHIDQRTRLTANAEVSDDVSVKITLQDTREWGNEGSTANTGTEGEGVDLKEGYLQVGNLLGSGLTLKAGRQVVAKGDQRILGGLEWSMSSRSHDGFALVHSSDAATVTALMLKTTELSSAAAPSDEDTDHYGVYAEVTAVENNQIDGYVILRRNGDNQEQLYTIGARVAGKVPSANVDYTVEIPIQFGDAPTQFVAGTDDSYGGWAVFAKAGYTVPGENKIRLGVEYDTWSGDATADADTENYVNLGLGTDHAHYGAMDINNPGTAAHGTAGLSLWGLNAKADVTPELSLYVAYWNATLNEVAAGASD